MQLSWGLLIVVAVFAVGVWLLRQALQLREIANTAAVEACERLSLQFLDGTSSLGTWRWQREGKSRRLRRVYVFDYTAQSIERRQGFVVLSRGRVESIGFAQDHPPAAPPPRYAPVVNVTMTFGVPKPQEDHEDDADSSRGKVLDLAEWRRTRRTDEPLH
jgi:Protein of unknown function (DUF3301)